MPRPKAFDRDAVLDVAMAVFWQKGYEATSTEDLRLAMGIGRQSFYDSFGGKREIFIEALRRYNDDRIATSVVALRNARSPIAAIKKLLLAFAEEDEPRRALGCLGIATICELGVRDDEVAEIGRTGLARLETAFTASLREAKKLGEVPESLRERPAARLLNATLAGMRVMSKAGASVETLRDVAAAAISGLTAEPAQRD